MRTIHATAIATLVLLAGCAAPPSDTPAHEAATHTPSQPTQPVILPSDTPEPLPSAAAATSAPTFAPLDLSSDLETIRLRMLHSHDNWHSIWVELEVTEYPPEGSDLLVRFRRLQAWVRRPGEILLLRGPLDGDPDYLLVSDGTRYLEADLATGLTQEGELAPSILEPFVAPEEISDTVTGYPLAGIIGYPAGDLIFPTGLAQRQGTYELIGEDTVAGRAALIVDFTPQPTGLIADRFRVDALTGVLLRHQVLGKTGGGEHVGSDLLVTGIVYEPAIPPGLFRLEIPEDLHFQEAPEGTATGQE